MFVKAVPSQTPDVGARIFRRRGARRLALVLACLTPLAGCADPNAPPGSGQKETAGTAVGAFVGGTLGAVLGRGNGRIVYGLLGAGVGALIGNRIGAALDAQDRQALALQQQQALLSQPDQQPVAWTSDHSQATATITPTNTRTERKTVKIIRQADVAEPSDLDASGAPYDARTTTRIHVAPDQKSASNGTVAGGSSIWVVGRLRSANWLLVARNGKSIGYVSGSRLTPPTRPASYAGTTPPAAPIAARGSSAPVGGAYDLDAPQNGDKVDLVSADVTCRDIKTDTDVSGKSDSTTKTVCRAPDGAWQLD